MDGDAPPQLNACNVEDVFKDYEERRAGLLKALTDDVVDFFRQCDPDKDNLRLYGLPGETWELKVPEEECELFEIPPPTIGINFARDMTSRDDRNWIKLVAIHSDSWLLAVAFYYAAKSGFDQDDRGRLHDMINDLPTLYETIKDVNKKKFGIFPGSTSRNNEASLEVEEDGFDEDEEDGMLTDDEDDWEQDEIDEIFRCPFCDFVFPRW